MNTARACVSAIFMYVLFSSTILVASELPDGREKSKPPMSNRVQTTFVANKGKVADSQIVFFANLINGIVYVKKNGMVSYDFSPEDNKNSLINEKFTTREIAPVPLEPPPAEIMALYKQKGYLREELANYYRISLAEIYQGVELMLTVFTDGLQKFLTVAPHGKPEMIQITLEGIKGLTIEKGGMLEIATTQGAVKLTKPQAYQMQENEKNPIEVSYRIHKGTTYGFEVGKYDKEKPLMIYYETRKGEAQ
jgi:hypothetical protein